MSRYHMFLSVYFHHVPIGYELMLSCFQREAGEELTFPASVEGYMDCDDLFLHVRLKASKNRWAKRVAERRAYRLLVEQKEEASRSPDEHSSIDFEDLLQSLSDSGIPAMRHTVEGRLSKYFSTGSLPPTNATDPQIYVLEEDERPTPIESYTPLYRRYAGTLSLRRVYVDPDHLDRARQVLRKSR
ncbi:MAG: hypothetical protein HC923_00985 [Myxococcales bacterium]|nr:hypothetical protein [Myxococcales bacterium]